MDIIAQLSIFFVLIGSLAGHAAQASQRPLPELTLEELAGIEVTTVSRRPEPLSHAAAAVYVITQEDIRRSGATTIPEALRLAPGVQVAQINSNQWAVGVRGFASSLSRSLLVLIDGRSVYSPLFAGTYWDVQDTLLEDIDRIEIIRGPGGTLWGANAVNGVINIITKTAKETQGGLVTAGGGNLEQGFGAFRYGGRTSSDLNYRIYSKFFNRGPLFHGSGNNFDDWRMGQVGFRADWAMTGGDSLTLQGDLYDGRSGQRTSVSGYTPPFQSVVDDDGVLSGGNILGTWGRRMGSSSDARLRFYYDRTNRKVPTFRENRDTLDLDFQYNFQPYESNLLIWGAEYRASSGDTTGIPTVAFLPPRRSDHLFSAFAQDEITLAPDHLRFTIGSKFEHNGYSGIEVQPTGLILWTPGGRQTLWGSVSRAVRTPSRVEQDLQLTAILDPRGPTFARIVGNKQFDSEKMIAVQSGYRIQPSSWVSLDLTAFLNDHDDLMSLRAEAPFLESVPPPDHLVVPFSLVNGIHGKSHGAEVVTDWRIFGWWRFVTAYSYLHLHLKNDPDTFDPNSATSTEGSSPRHQMTLQSFVNLPRNLEFDWVFRYISALPTQKVDSYSTASVHLGWRPTPQLELSIIGQNLLQPHHLEFSGGPSGSEVKRTFYGKITWLW